MSAHEMRLSRRSLCFSRVDCKEKCLTGRIVQFSYMKGSKKERQYSSVFVDLTKESYKNIGVFANCFQGTRNPAERENSTVTFTPLADVFTPGYLSLEHYLSSINDSTMIVSPNYSFSLSTNVLKKVLPRLEIQTYLRLVTDRTENDGDCFIYQGLVVPIVFSVNGG